MNFNISAETEELLKYAVDKLQKYVNQVRDEYHF